MLELSKKDFKVLVDESSLTNLNLGELPNNLELAPTDASMVKNGLLYGKTTCPKTWETHEDWKKDKLIKSVGTKTLYSIQTKIARALASVQGFIPNSTVDLARMYLGYITSSDPYLFERTYVLLNSILCNEYKDLELFNSKAYHKDKIAAYAANLNKVSKRIKRSPEEYEQMTGAYSRADIFVLKKICKDAYKAHRAASKNYLDYFYHKFLRQDEEAATVIANRPHFETHSSTICNCSYYVKHDNEGLETVYAQAVEGTRAYYLRGRLALLSYAIEAGICPTEYIVWDGVVAKENEEINIKDRDKMVKAALDMMLNEYSDEGNAVTDRLTMALRNAAYNKVLDKSRKDTLHLVYLGADSHYHNKNIKRKHVPWEKINLKESAKEVLDYLEKGLI